MRSASTVTFFVGIFSLALVAQAGLSDVVVPWWSAPEHENVDPLESTYNVGKCSVMPNIEGFLIDLDGTMYEPEGLVNGAGAFFDWLVASKIPYVFLSNSGAKGAVGVQHKFSTQKYLLKDRVPLSNIYTAAMATAQYVSDNVPAGSRVFVVQTESRFVGEGGKDFVDNFTKVLGRLVPDAESKWDLKHELTDGEAKEWALEAKNGGSVYVVLCTDGYLKGPEYSDGPAYGWTYSLMGRIGWLIHNGAHMVNSAPDTHADLPQEKGERYKDLDLSMMGPGVLFEAFKANSYPNGLGKMVTVGKGGNEGHHYSMEMGRRMLKEQGASGDPSKIVMVGDVLNTDIAGAVSAGMKGVMVLSGRHQLRDIRHYPETPPECVLHNVGEIPALHDRKPHLRGD